MKILVGGVSELYQGDLDLGRLAVERLTREPLASYATVEDLHYGAVAVSQRFEELRPDVLLLLGAVQRGDAPGTVRRRRVQPVTLAPSEVQAAVGDAVTGYVHIDLIVQVATAFGTLPKRVVTLEVEPADMASGEGLSAPAAAGLERLLDLARTEVGRAPLLELGAELEALLDGERLEDSSGLSAMRALLAELRGLDREGHWGRTFALRDRLRQAIAASASSEGMESRDWALWWTLIEELDRLEALEAVGSG